ncbi:hypothetical protein [Persephonella sp.]
MEIKESITQEIIDTLIDLIKKTLGENTVKIILDNSKNQDGTSGREIIFSFADEMQKLIGDKGAFASMRQLGRDLSRQLMSANPREEWNNILETALNEFGFAEKIEKTTDKAYICSCVFYEILEKNGLKPVTHAVCWAGWGFIEGFVKEMEGAKGIQWVERDYENEKCRFDFVLVLYAIDEKL